MPPSSRSQSAATTALAGGTCELFRVKFLREIPHWWILGRCPPPNDTHTPRVGLQKLPKVQFLYCPEPRVQRTKARRATTVYATRRRGHER